MAVPEQIFACVMILVGAVMTARWYPRVRVAYASRAWPRAPGRITYSGRAAAVERDETPRVLGVAPYFGYEYTVGGETYRGTRVSWTDVSGYRTSHLLARFPVGCAVEVAYDPADPSSAVLLPGPTFSGLAHIAYGAAVMLAGALWLLLPSPGG